MAPIDLVPFAEHSVRLPSTFLNAVKANKKETWKVLCAHYFDFTATIFTVMFTGTMFNRFMDVVLVTTNLREAFHANEIVGLSLLFIPAGLFTYFFSSFFMNHGQSWGMFLLKKRIQMKAQSFKDAFHFACHSTLLCLSCGLSWFWQKEIWNSVSRHDYLYEKMMIIEGSETINILAIADKYSAEVDQVTEWEIAA